MRARRAFILAAGFGTRLRPLSERVPKPLWPLFDVPIGAHLTRSLERAGVEEFIVNLHHLPERLENGLAPWFAPEARVSWSLEEKILGTGGALVPWLDTLSEGPFILANADTYRGFEPSRMIERFSSEPCAACLSLSPLEDGKPGPVGIDEGGRIASFLGARAPGAGEPSQWCDFTGMHVLSPEIALEVGRVGREREFFCINADVHRTLVARGLPYLGFVAPGSRFCDLGTPGSYLGAHFDFLRAGEVPTGVGGTLHLTDARTPEGGLLLAPLWLGEGAIVEAGAKAGPFAVVGAGARLLSGASVECSVVWPGVEVSGAVRLKAIAKEGFVESTEKVCR